MQHTEFGFEVVQKFLKEVEPWGHRDFEPKLIGRGINVMVSPHPRNKRAKNPYEDEDGSENGEGGEPKSKPKPPTNPSGEAPVKIHKPAKPAADGESADGFANNPFDSLKAD